MLHYRNSKNLKYIQIAMKLLLIAMIVFGSVRSSAVAWNLADVGVGFMAWVNLIALILLYKPVIKILKDYEQQKKLGIDPVFEPEKCGIKNAELWDKITKSRYADLLQNKKKILESKDEDVAI